MNLIFEYGNLDDQNIIDFLNNNKPSTPKRNNNGTYENGPCEECNTKGDITHYIENCPKFQKNREKLEEYSLK